MKEPTAWRRHLATARRRVRTALHPDVTVLPAPANVRVDWDVPVPMRDSTVLRVNVFRPPPTSLCR